MLLFLKFKHLGNYIIEKNNTNKRYTLNVQMGTAARSVAMSLGMQAVPRLIPASY